VTKRASCRRAVARCSGRRRRYALVLLVGALLLTACQTSVLREAPRTPAPASTAPAQPAPTRAGAPPTAAPAGPASPVAASPPAPTASPAASAASPAAAPTPLPFACSYGPTRRIAEAQDKAIKEASALVASQRWPGVYWTLNVSGSSPTLYALDEEGRERGTF
jgi:hypothetical protein